MNTLKNGLFFCLVVLMLSLGCAHPASADSWALPDTETYISPNGNFRLTVIPAPIGSQLEYFEEELEAQQKGEAVERPRPLAMFERQDNNGDWMPLWSKPLVNHVAPVSALVSNDGAFFVTFDNWHSVGFGENVIVIYTGSGDLVVSHTLTDMVSIEYIEALPRSVSSVYWAKDKSIDEASGLLVIDMLMPSDDRDDPASIQRLIKLEDGAILPPDAERWAVAQARVEEAKARREEAEAERLRYLTEPLPIPSSTEMGDWHRYLREAFQRLTPKYLDAPTAATEILFPPEHERHETSVGWLVDAFKDDADWGGDIAIASPTSDTALLSALEEAAAAVEPGSLSQTTFYLSIHADHIDCARGILAPTGGTLIWLDPTVAIPQRLERIPGSPEEKAADEERRRRMTEETKAMMEEML